MTGALVLAAAVALLAGAPQDASSPMLQVVRQMRETAAQMRGKLPPEEIAEMLAAADQIERDARAGAYNPPPPPRQAGKPAADPAKRLVAEHGKVDWLDQQPACVGYGWENYRTFHLSSGDRDAERDGLCKTAYGHFYEYFMTVRNGGDHAKAARALEAYDQAAKAAVKFYERR